MEPVELDETPKGTPAAAGEASADPAGEAPAEPRVEPRCAVSQEIPGEENKEETKEEAKEAAEEGTKEGAKEETAEETREEAKEETAEETREAAEEGTKEVAKEGPPGGARRAKRQEAREPKGGSAAAPAATEAVLARICKELSLPRVSVDAAAALLAEGNTVAFVARYRKEATRSLDEATLRAIEERMAYFGELLERRETVIKTIDKAGRLTPELRLRIETAWTKTELEDLYLPHRPKKRTKAAAARELGLESLLDELLADGSGADPLMLASPYVKEGQEGLAAPSACLEGAGHILAERLSEDAEVRAWLRQEFYDKGTLTSRLRPTPVPRPTPAKAARPKGPPQATDIPQATDAAAADAPPTIGAQAPDAAAPQVPDAGAPAAADAPPTIDAQAPQTADAAAPPAADAPPTIDAQAPQTADAAAPQATDAQAPPANATQTAQAAQAAQAQDAAAAKAKAADEPRPSQAALRFKPYWDYSEAIRKVPPHRVLAIRRGEKEGALSVRLVVDRERLVAELASRVAINPKSSYRASLRAVCGDAFDRLLAPALETDVRVEAKRRADADAIKVFQTNLDSLLLAPPAGQTCTLGVDPGIRAGCRLAVINRLGQFMEAATVHPLEPRRDLEGTRAALQALAEKYPIETVAVGNGTGGREAEAVVAQWLSDTGRDGVRVVSVSAAGASAYSASDAAREEFPELDPAARGAVSIARRFQDPLAELAKVEPKSIGVGQYQHDVNQTQLKKGLDDAVASCVNRVGVDLNTASFSLLSYVSGLGGALARGIVQWRRENGPFRRREQLMEVPGLNEMAFRQSAGFLRIRDGENPLDASSVHPESYPVVQRICQVAGKPVPELIGDGAALDSLDPKALADERFGPETVRDVIEELKAPGRDPRRKFEAAGFNDGVASLSDVRVGMELQGVVANVTDFGAFIDVGARQDGLVHRSEIAHRFVQRPSDALSVGQPVRVKVLSVDHEAKRIGLSIKALAPPPPPRPAKPSRPDGPDRPDRPDRPNRPNRPDRPDRPDRPKGPRPEGSDRRRTGRTDGPRGPGRPDRSDRPRPAERADGAPPPPPTPSKQEAAEGQPPGPPATLGDLMARFNRGLRGSG